MKENLQKNAGIILIVLGALMLMVSYFTKDWVDYNWYQLVCRCLSSAASWLRSSPNCRR